MKPWIIYRWMKIFNFFLTAACLIVLAGAVRLLLVQDSVQEIHSEAVQVAQPPEEPSESQEVNDALAENFMMEDTPIIENIDTGIQLKGMLSYPGHRYAIVEFKNEQKLVKAGEKIGDWQVTDLDEENLKITHDGKMAVIRQDHQAFKNIAKPAVIEKEIVPVISQTEIPENKITVDEKDFHGLMSNWADLFKGVQMMPYVEKGKSKGYVLCYLQPDGLMQKLGFRTGDIIEKINDKEITNLRALLALYDFAEKGDCRVVIKRGPKKIQMVYQLNKHTV